jgi:chromosome segregation ATPase
MSFDGGVDEQPEQSQKVEVPLDERVTDLERRVSANVKLAELFRNVERVRLECDLTDLLAMTDRAEQAERRVREMEQDIGYLKEAWQQADRRKVAADARAARHMERAVQEEARARANEQTIQNLHYELEQAHQVVQIRDRALDEWDQQLEIWEGVRGQADKALTRIVQLEAELAGTRDRAEEEHQRLVRATAAEREREAEIRIVNNRLGIWERAGQRVREAVYTDKVEQALADDESAYAMENLTRAVRGVRAAIPAEGRPTE